VKQLLFALLCIVALASLARSQTAASGNSPSATSSKPRTVRAAPKPPTPRVHTAVPNAPARKSGNVGPYSDALGRYQHARHTRFWWKRHFTTFALAGGGYYYFDSGYWFPAWGYDPNYEAYDYDGPIFTYGNLLPDQVIISVQRALQELGYYTAGITGALSPATRQAITAYQQDEGLEVNGVIDGPTVYALGLI
jgi:Putative peptidoglycan binding domain